MVAKSRKTGKRVKGLKVASLTAGRAKEVKGGVLDGTSNTILVGARSCPSDPSVQMIKR